MYGPLNRPLMQEWSKQRYVHTLPLIYFQKLLQFLSKHNHKAPKMGLRKTKNMTSESGSVQTTEFHPYVTLKSKRKTLVTGTT